MFLTTDWVQVDQLKAFLDARGTSRSSPFVIRLLSPLVGSYAASSGPLAHQKTHVMHENAKIHVKSEPNSDWDITDLSSLSPSPPPLPRPRIQVKTHTVYLGSTEVIEILSSDDEMDIDEADSPQSEDSSQWSGDFSSEVSFGSGGQLDEEEDLVPPTNWRDPKITSEVVWQRDETTVTRQCSVERVEILTALPSCWPVPRIPTAYIVDLRDAKYKIAASKGSNGFFSPDGLIKDTVSRHCLPGLFSGPLFVFVYSSLFATLAPLMRHLIYLSRIKTAGPEAQELVIQNLLFTFSRICWDPKPPPSRAVERACSAEVPLCAPNSILTS